MMCSLILRPHKAGATGFEARINRILESVTHAYTDRMRTLLGKRGAMGFAMLAILGVSAIIMTEVKFSYAAFIVAGLLALAFVAARKTGVLKDAGSVKGR